MKLPIRIVRILCVGFAAVGASIILIEVLPSNLETKAGRPTVIEAAPPVETPQNEFSPKTALPHPPAPMEPQGNQRTEKRDGFLFATEGSRAKIERKAVIEASNSVASAQDELRNSRASKHAFEQATKKLNLANERLNRARENFYIADKASDLSSTGKLSETADPKTIGSPSAQDNSECASKLRSLGVVAEHCFDIEPVIRSLRVGRYTFNKPKVAYVGSPFRIILHLTTADSQEEAKESFTKTDGDQVTVAAPFSQSVDATLRGADFVIEPGGPQRRTASLLNGVEWEWSVTPRETGKKSLAMEVVANLWLNNALVPYQVRTLRTEIEIAISPIQQVKQLVTEAGGATIGFGAVIASLAGLLATARPATRKIARLLRLRRHRKSAHNGARENAPD